MPGSDPEVVRAVRAALDAKTKPRGSLGRLEDLAVRIAAVRGTSHPGRLRAAVVLAAADHGVAVRGVSAYPQEVTGQMLANFAAGGAAICVLARLAGADLHVFDLGVVSPLAHPRVRDLRIAPGTADLAEGAAMSLEQARRAIDAGRGVAAELADDGIGLVALGEMGIGNSTSAAALAAALLPADPEVTCGRGTGIARGRRRAEGGDRAPGAGGQRGADGRPAGHARGPRRIRDRVPCRGGARGAPRGAWSCCSTGSSRVRRRSPPSGSPPGCERAMIAAHVSAERGHRLVLDALGLEPLLDLGLRLGEGSGAALALPIVHAALAVLEEMATFDSAGVTDAGR